MPKRTYQPNNPPPRQETRISRADGNEKRTLRDQTPPRQRSQSIDGQTLLDFRLPKELRLRKPAEFRRVYDHGKRFDGKLMTIFILPSGGAAQRLGVTASKKLSNKAHDRNRAKRLLRETFRLSRAELDDIETKFDWVLNARRGLLQVKLAQPLAEFRRIAAQIKIFELEQGEKRIKSLAK